jgi:hypothetical protein
MRGFWSAGEVNTRGVKAKKNRRDERMVMVDRDGGLGCGGWRKRSPFWSLGDLSDFVDYERAAAIPPKRAMRAPRMQRKV